jgi:hypothetical protein
MWLADNLSTNANDKALGHSGAFFIDTKLPFLFERQKVIFK